MHTWHIGKRFQVLDAYARALAELVAKANAMNEEARWTNEEIHP